MLAITLGSIGDGYHTDLLLKRSLDRIPFPAIFWVIKFNEFIGKNSIEAREEPMPRTRKILHCSVEFAGSEEYFVRKFLMIHGQFSLHSVYILKVHLY